MAGVCSGLILGNMDVNTSDEEVIARCLKGDSDAFAVIVRRYQARFLRLAGGALTDAASAQDVVQETFIKAYTRLNQYRPETSFPSWLYTVFSNCLKDDLRRRKRQGGLLDRLRDYLLIEYETPEPEPETPDTSWIRPALSQLSEKQRICVLLRDIEQMEMSKVAEKLGINETTVRVHLMRGRKKLREIYEREVRKQ